MSTIIFKPTHNCNLNCSFCYDRFEKAENKAIMSLEKAIEVLWKAIPEMGEGEREPVRVIWHGGEPLLAGVEYFEQIFKEFQELNVSWSVQTNGALFNKEWSELFKKYHVSIGSSWDGEFDVNKGTHCWDYIQKILNQGNPVGVIYTITPQNMDKVIPVYLFAKSQPTLLGVDFAPVFNEGCSLEEYRQMAYYMAQLFDFLCTQEDGHTSRPFNHFLSWLKCGPPIDCDMGGCELKWVGIQPNGDITHCGRSWGKQFIMGNAFDPNFHFNELKDNPITKQLQKAATQQQEWCRKCKYVFSCNNGCLSSAFDKNGELSFDQDHCAFWKTFYDLCNITLKHHLQNQTLKNTAIIEALNFSPRLEYEEWKNYTYPSTEI